MIRTRPVRIGAVSLATFGALSVAVGLAGAGTASAQDQPASSTSVLNLPTNPTVFGTSLPSVVKATAIINGEVITQTDVDQRLALLAIANDGQIPANELDRLRQRCRRRAEGERRDRGPGARRDPFKNYCHDAIFLNSQPDT